MTLSKTKAGLALATGIFALTASLIGATLRFAQKFAELDTRLAKIESAVKVLNASTIDERYKQVIKELMAEERSADVSKKADAGHRFGGPTYPADAGASANMPATPK